MRRMQGEDVPADRHPHHFPVRVANVEVCREPCGQVFKSADNVCPIQPAEGATDRAYIHI